MDLLSMLQTVWRHKLATLPVIALTVLGAVYVIGLKAPVYQAASSYVLIAPPSAPTTEQIARDPALGRINSDNPYVRFGDLGVVVDVLTQAVSTTAAQQQLVREGADSRYVVAPSVVFGSAPIIQITALGISAAEAMRSATLVDQELKAELARLQANQGVDRRYWITALQLNVPDQAQLQLSSKLRSLIGVLVLGVVMLFVVVSMMSGLAERRARARFAVDEDSLGGEIPAEWSTDLDRDLDAEERDRINAVRRSDVPALSEERSRR
jgi:hypothetical protein